MDTVNQELEFLKQQLATQGEQIKLLLGALGNMQQNTGVNQNERIKIVNLVQREPGLSTYIKLSNLEINMSNFGEERSVTLQQFEEMVGNYRRWFDDGIITIASGYEEIADVYGLKTAKDYPLNSDFMVKLKSQDIGAIEKIWSKLPTSGKSFVVDYWTNRAVRDIEGFRDIYKLETLNRLSGGALSNLIREFTETKRQTK